jgi:hypothetical protein
MESDEEAVQHFGSKTSHHISLSMKLSDLRSLKDRFGQFAGRRSPQQIEKCTRTTIRSPFSLFETVRCSQRNNEHCIHRSRSAHSNTVTKEQTLTSLGRISRQALRYQFHARNSVYHLCTPYRYWRVSTKPSIPSPTKGQVYNKSFTPQVQYTKSIMPP